MCGIAGVISLSGESIEHVDHYLSVMNKLIVHRGPDDSGTWIHPSKTLGFTHRRLSVIDLSENAKQPMKAQNGNVITYNGEIYNYKELYNQLLNNWPFVTKSDTECILAAFNNNKSNFLSRLRGMFAFSLWDEANKELLCVRDRFGIKPFYYIIVNGLFFFASEVKALLPFLDEISTEPSALAEYLTFQYILGEKTLFKDVKQLLPGHYLKIYNGNIEIKRYWDIHYSIDYDHSQEHFKEQLEQLFDDSIRMHLRSDVPVGAYLSGGIDSSLISIKSSSELGYPLKSFHGRFLEYPGFDESNYAHSVSNLIGGNFHSINMTADDFMENIQKVIYYMDYPVAGPGAFPQFMVSKLASGHVKVVLGGQGGDEIFGGYARYLLAYFEQCIKASIEGTYKDGNFVVTPETIIPNLTVLNEYKPLIKEFWKEGLFEDLDERYFRLCDRSVNLKSEINWEELDTSSLKHSFKNIFNNETNVGHQAYFDKMTHFDFKCLLPALLHVEDRMSMAHGIESRVPFLDHPLVEMVATVPADVKFKDGKMKYFLLNTFKDVLPDNIYNRRDKMGFPVPLNSWFNNELKDWIYDIFNDSSSVTRPFVNTKLLLSKIQTTNKFSRELWGLFCLELWQKTFHDKAFYYKNLLKQKEKI